MVVCDSHIPLLQMDHLDLLQLLREGRIRTLDTLEQSRPYRIIHIDRICFRICMVPGPFTQNTSCIYVVC